MYDQNESARACLELVERIFEKYGGATVVLPTKPGLPINYHHPLTPEARATIMELHRKGANPGFIAKQVGYARDTVTKTLRKHGIWISGRISKRDDSPEMKAAVREFFATEKTMCHGRYLVIANKHGVDCQKFRQKVAHLRRNGRVEQYLTQAFTRMTVVPAERPPARNAYATEVA